MHCNKPSRLTFFGEDFYCPMIYEVERDSPCQHAHASPLSLPKDYEPHKVKSQDQLSENSESILFMDAVTASSEIVDENCNVIQEEVFLDQQQDDHNYSTQEQEEIDMKVENAIGSDPDAILQFMGKADVWTNTSQSRSAVDAASGTSQPVMVECAAGTSQPLMVECGIQTSQDFGLRALKDETNGRESPKLKPRYAVNKPGAPIILHRLPIQTCGPEVPVKIRRIDQNLPTIYSVPTECFDFEDYNKENSTTDYFHRGYKNKGKVTRASKGQKPMEDCEVSNENEGVYNESTSSRGTFLRVGLSKKSRTLKPLHAKVPLGDRRHFNIQKPSVSKNEESDDDDE